MACMDVRQVWKLHEEVVPAKKELCLRPIEYVALKELTMYVPVKVTMLCSIRIEQKDENLNPIEFTSNDLHCTIHFLKRALY